jgi:hypothetical protein
MLTWVALMSKLRKGKDTHWCDVSWFSVSGETISSLFSLAICSIAGVHLSLIIEMYLFQAFLR